MTLKQFIFSCGHATLSEALSIRWSVSPSVRPGGPVSDLVFVEQKQGRITGCAKNLVLAIKSIKKTPRFGKILSI